MQTQSITIRTDIGQAIRPMYSTSKKTVQQVLVETYLLYRKMFFEKGMLTHGEYFSVIKCINR